MIPRQFPGRLFYSFPFCLLPTHHFTNWDTESKRVSGLPRVHHRAVAEPGAADMTWGFPVTGTEFVPVLGLPHKVTAALQSAMTASSPQHSIPFYRQGNLSVRA